MKMYKKIRVWKIANFENKSDTKIGNVNIIANTK